MFFYDMFEFICLFYYYFCFLVSFLIFLLNCTWMLIVECRVCHIYAFYVDVRCVHYKFVQLIIRLAFYCTFLYFLATCRIAATNVI